MKILKCNDYCFKVKWGRKYIWPKHYEEVYYSERQIPDIIKEIEEEYPKYKGRVFAFRRCLIKI